MKRIDMLNKKQVVKLVLDYYNIAEKDFNKKYLLAEKYINSRSRKTKLSLKHNNYMNDDYVYGAVACYNNYSKVVLRAIDSHKHIFKTVSSILDLGAGGALTTMHLKQIFPNAKVYYNNLINTQQVEFAKFMNSKYSLNLKFLLSDTIFTKEQHIDLIFACDFFEHILEPIEYIKNVIKVYSPKYLVISNAFLVEHPDHLRVFKVGSDRVNYKKMPRIFNNFVRSKGYMIHPITYSMWNRRPCIFVKKS